MKNYLLRDIVLDTTTTCSINEAVGMMLGMQKGAQWYIDTEMENDHYEKFRDDEIPEPLYFDLLGELEGERIDLQNEYYDAKEAGSPKTVLDEKLNAIKEFDDTKMKLAKIYLCLIEDEFLKGTASQLRFNDRKEISLASLDKWWDKCKKESIQTSIFKDMQFREPKPKKVADDNSAAEISTYVTLGLAIKALISQSQGVRYGTIDKPIISTIAQDLSAHIKGQSKSSIEKRVKRAIDELNDHLNK